MQSRAMSLLEAWANVVVGIGVQYTAAMWALHLLGFPITHRQNIVYAAFMTAVSMGRSYGLRRLFNRLGKNRAT